MSVKDLNEVKKEKVAAGKNTFFQVLIGADEGPNFAMRRFIIEPGGSMPRHTNLVEHEQFVLRGKAKVGIGDQVYEMSANKVVYIPAGIPHWYETQGDEPFEFLCIIPNKPDKIEIMDS